MTTTDTATAAATGAPDTPAATTNPDARAGTSYAVLELYENAYHPIGKAVQARSRAEAVRLVVQRDGIKRSNELVAIPTKNLRVISVALEPQAPKITLKGA